MNICILNIMILSSFVTRLTHGVKCSTCSWAQSSNTDSERKILPEGCENSKVKKEIATKCNMCGWTIELPWSKDEPISGGAGWTETPSVRQKGVILEKMCQNSTSGLPGTCLRDSYNGWLWCYCDTDLCNEGKPPCSMVISQNVRDTDFLKVFCTEEEMRMINPKLEYSNKCNWYLATLEQIRLQLAEEIRPTFNSDMTNQCSGVLPTLEQMKVQLSQVYFQITSSSDN